MAEESICELVFVRDQNGTALWTFDEVDVPNLATGGATEERVTETIIEFDPDAISTEIEAPIAAALKYSSPGRLAGWSEVGRRSGIYDVDLAAIPPAVDVPAHPAVFTQDHIGDGA